mmetsp:Transcript_20150/g.33956  ORF Transcript_20150/g.33956 Transcript_20150/m.33956 type:complete len:137 (-) Transcript_20150:161-571(-)|eukprot:CAMPEP_0114449164 /NCGR_PEP_ID=MMETSP0103-20121206/20716_1 /TAXON_ID=37642 ORGANISM="Paraphysomonas imperforata, Strain PA2" /NCGR_SAMPLE_ID=MMETSP0103 /ASSEMBLY_ACC=CAM_ASM_000201 /LENGTH=136 /DNA_ID=CAMNT_0001621235 /DNA_START=57 /DNA_END=467 /DNA_ORIENTATION=+
MAASKKNVLTAYAKLVRLCKLLPEKEKAQAFVRVREGFRKNADEVNPEKITAALKSANSSIGYVKMMTPKHLQKNSASGPSDGVTRIVIGDKAKSGRNPTSNWTGSNMDPDSVKRHQRSLQRAGFTSNRHAKGPAF